MKQLPRLTASCFVIIMGCLSPNGSDSHAWASNPHVILVMTDDQSKECGAYHVYVTRIDK